MFWDGDRWVDDRPLNRQGSPVPLRPRRRLRRWLVAIAIVVLVPALLIPFWPVSAAGPRLTVGGNAVPGASLTVVGDGFDARLWIQLLWDGSAAGMPTVRTSGQGTFGTSLKIPTNAAPGPHLVGAGVSSSRGRGVAPAATTAALASATVMVLDPAAAPTLVVTDPTQTVPSDPTQTVTPAPTQTATPDPTQTATPDPTQIATPDPTPVPTPTPTAPVPPNPTQTPNPTQAPTSTPVPVCGAQGS